MKEIDNRLDRIIEVCDQLDLPLDHVVAHMGRCRMAVFEAKSADRSRLPQYVRPDARS